MIVCPTTMGQKESTQNIPTIDVSKELRKFVGTQKFKIDLRNKAIIDPLNKFALPTEITQFKKYLEDYELGFKPEVKRIGLIFLNAWKATVRVKNPLKPIEFNNLFIYNQTITNSKLFFLIDVSNNTYKIECEVKQDLPLVKVEDYYFINEDFSKKEFPILKEKLIHAVANKRIMKTN